MDYDELKQAYEGLKKLHDATNIAVEYWERECAEFRRINWILEDEQYSGGYHKWWV